jgi:ubiquinone/menaquinone biosynthesis C-methylase UbiE
MNSLAYKNYQSARITHWDEVARKQDSWNGLGGYYHRRLKEVYCFLIPPGQKVLEMGCGQGDLLAALEPKAGVGIDFSSEMIQRAKKRHPDLIFIQADAHELEFNETFETIILSDLVNDIWDVQQVFECINKVCRPETRIVLNTYSRLWEPLLSLAESFNLAKPVLHQNWLTVDDIDDLLYLENFEIIRSWPEVLLPLGIPGLAGLCNRYLVKLWPFKNLALTNFILARPLAGGYKRLAKPSVSVMIPARNEAGNIPKIFTEVPEMGERTELVFVEGHSTDDTYTAIEQEIQNYPYRPAKLAHQDGKGKGDAVRKGFSLAEGDILMILDADLTVPPEDMVRFYDALVSGKAEFVNGVRLVYPMEGEAMRFFNLVGNKFFSRVFTWLLGQPVKDTLCGTKVLWKHDYDRIAANRAYFGDFDPFGDFDLLFGAARLGLKIVDLPVRYRERTYGTTNINRWKHGWLLLQMVTFAAGKIKFV